MKRNILIYGLLVLAPCGCSSMNNTEKDALAGGGAGAVAGGLLTRGNPGAILVGGLLGTGVGAMIGSDQDRRDRHDKAVAQAQANAAVAARNQMSVQEVITLSQRNIGDDVIIRQMDTTGSVFALTTNDILDLQNNGVSSRVISAMQARRYNRPMVVQPGPVYMGPPAGVVIVEQGPPPPVSFGVGWRVH